MTREDFLKIIDTKEFDLLDIEGLIQLLLHRNDLVKRIIFAKGKQLESLMFNIETVNNQIKGYLNL